MELGCSSSGTVLAWHAQSPWFNSQHWTRWCTPIIPGPGKLKQVDGSSRIPAYILISRLTWDRWDLVLKRRWYNLWPPNKKCSAMPKPDSFSSVSHTLSQNLSHQTSPSVVAGGRQRQRKGVNSSCGLYFSTVSEYLPWGDQEPPTNKGSAGDVGAIERFKHLGNPRECQQLLLDKNQWCGFTDVTLEGEFSKLA